MGTISFDNSICADLDASLPREWLGTNGIGGFASSTITGLNTRRYHGLLVARGLAQPFTINLHSGCPSLVVFFATGWGSSRRSICGVGPSRSRFRAGN